MIANNVIALVCLSSHLSLIIGSILDLWTSDKWKRPCIFGQWNVTPLPCSEGRLHQQLHVTGHTPIYNFWVQGPSRTDARTDAHQSWNVPARRKYCLLQSRCLDPVPQVGPYLLQKHMNSYWVTEAATCWLFGQSRNTRPLMTLEESGWNNLTTAPSC